MDSKSIIQWCALVPVLVLTACSSQRPAPVVDRSGRSPRHRNSADRRLQPYRASQRWHLRCATRRYVQNVALAFGVDPKDLARWNGVTESDALIPGADTASHATRERGDGQSDYRQRSGRSAAACHRQALRSPGRAGAVAACRRATVATPPVAVAPPAAAPPVAAAPETSRAPISIAAVDMANSRQSHRDVRRSTQQGNRYRGQRRCDGASRSRWRSRLRWQCSSRLWQSGDRAA